MTENDFNTRFAGVCDSKQIYYLLNDAEKALLKDALEAAGQPVFTDDTNSADTLRMLGIIQGEAGGRNYTLNPSAYACGEVIRHDLHARAYSRSADGKTTTNTSNTSSSSTSNGFSTISRRF